MGERTSARPEDAYRWFLRHHLAEAATVTVTTGVSFEEVLISFGAEPDSPQALPEVLHDPFTVFWVVAFETVGHVVIVENNGARGTDTDLLRVLSRHGRAASMHWNCNALSTLSFARRGELLMSAELGTQKVHDDPEVQHAISHLDGAGTGEFPISGLVAVERFTGRGLEPADLDDLDSRHVIYALDW